MAPASVVVRTCSELSVSEFTADEVVWPNVGEPHRQAPSATRMRAGVYC